MSISVNQLFYGGWRDAGLVLVEQTGLDSAQLEEARQIYNRMVDAWRSDGLTISHLSRNPFPIVPNKSDYTIGPGGDIDTLWPERIERASIEITSQSPSPELPMVALTIDEWQDWRLKRQITNWSRAFFYERSFPLGIIHLVYVPTDANNLILYLEEPISQIDAADDSVIEFPPGYQEAIETNLAVRIAARHPKEQSLSEDTRELAIKSLNRIMNANNRPLERATDFTWRRGQVRNVYSGNRY